MPNHTIPTALTESLGLLLAPILSIYYEGDTPSVTMPNTNTLLLQQGTASLTIDLVGKSTSEVVSAISRSSMPYSARPMLEVPDVSAVLGSITLSDRTVDGGIIMRGLGHVVRNLESTRIRLLPPYNDDRHVPWHVVVNNGWVTKQWRGGTWKFTVPEYPDQTWSLKYGIGFVDVDDEVAAYVGPQAVRVSRTPIHWDRKNLTLKVRGKVLPDSAIRDVDVNNGIVYLNRDVADNETVLATYTYEEPGYIYRGIDLNPTEFHNPAIMDQWVVFYLLPHIGPDGYIRDDCLQHVQSNTLAGAIRTIPPVDEPIIILGAIQIRDTSEPTDVQVTDTRTRGGGVKWDRRDDATRYTREVLSASDVGFYDGKPYPAGLALFVTLPQELKETFTDAELDAIVKRFVEYGTYCFLEFE